MVTQQGFNPGYLPESDDACALSVLVAPVGMPSARSEQEFAASCTTRASRALVREAKLVDLG
jgi:hypothetical protein